MKGRVRAQRAAPAGPAHRGQRTACSRSRSGSVTATRRVRRTASARYREPAPSVREAGRYASTKAPARVEGVHHAYVAKLLRLTLLAPDLIEAVLDGRLPKGVRLEDLVRPLPADWVAQRRVLLKGGGG